MSDLVHALNRIREHTSGAPYEGRLYIVGGYVRDILLGREPNEDIDIVLEGDALVLGRLLYERGVSSIHPVEYPRFGTVRLEIDGVPTELVSARAESYEPDSRKPDTRPATLLDDALRRDFTINTLMENLHTGERLDLLGVGESDLHACVIRTPTDPDVTFSDDPLRMLRAVRMATVLEFESDPQCWEAIQRNLDRLRIISMERIRDEFLKIVASPHIRRGMNLLRESGLLDLFLPELSRLHGVTQNDFHIYDVWDHTLAAFDGLAEGAPMAARLGLLFHDIGKPAARTVGEDGFVHFYQHELVGAEMTREALRRLKLPNDEIEQVARLVSLHMRIGHYTPEWGDAAVRRLIRDAGEQLDELCALYDADRSATNLVFEGVQLEQLRARIEAIRKKEDILALDSPLDGREIMDLLGIEPGPLVGEVKDYLLNEVIEGRLSQDDKATARRLILEKWPPS
jgi:poly(A) polymerase